MHIIFLGEGHDSRRDEKKAAGWAALEYVEAGSIVGVGTGSTVNHFIDALATMKNEIKGAVSSSVASTEKLKELGIEVFDCNDVAGLDVYVDGADEINGKNEMIKGGGAALTREKKSLLQFLINLSVLLMTQSKLMF